MAGDSDDISPAALALLIEEVRVLRRLIEVKERLIALGVHAYRPAIDGACRIGRCSLNNCLYPDCTRP